MLQQARRNLTAEVNPRGARSGTDGKLWSGTRSVRPGRGGFAVTFCKILTGFWASSLPKPSMSIPTKKNLTGQVRNIAEFATSVPAAIYPARSRLDVPREILAAQGQPQHDGRSAACVFPSDVTLWLANWVTDVNLLLACCSVPGCCPWCPPSTGNILTYRLRKRDVPETDGTGRNIAEVTTGFRPAAICRENYVENVKGESSNLTTRSTR